MSLFSPLNKKKKKSENNLLTTYPFYRNIGKKNTKMMEKRTVEESYYTFTYI